MITLTRFNTPEESTMTETKVEHGACLMCDRDKVLLMPGGPIGRHPTEPEQLGNHADFAESLGDLVVCIGSGHTQRHGDGRDDARRFGIRHCTTAESLAARAQAKMEGLNFAAGIDFAGEAVMVNGYLGKFWRTFAIHGEWPTGVRDALRYALVETRVAHPLGDAIAHCQALAARQWLREAKWQLPSVYADGVPAEDFAKMLFSV